MVTTTTPGGQRVSIYTCTWTGRHLATFTRWPRSSLYTLATEPPHVAGSAQVSASGPVAPPCSCRLLSHQTLLPPTSFSLIFPGHPSLPRLGHPSLPRLHVRLQLRERFRHDLPVLRLHCERGGEFSSDFLRDFCRGDGILQSFTLPASPQQNGIAERHIGLVMEVARTSMIHAAAPHFLWPFAVRYAAHQLNLWPRVSSPETSLTLRWTGEVGDASVFGVCGYCAFVRDTSADKLSSHAIPCIFLGFPPDAPAWQFYHPTLRRVFPSQGVTFDKSVPFYRLFPFRSAPPPPPPLFLAPCPPQVDPLPPQGPAPSVGVVSVTGVGADEELAIGAGAVVVASASVGVAAVVVVSTATDVDVDVVGFMHVCDADYDKTYSPVSSFVTLRIFLSIVAVLDLNLMQLDMKNAFLHSELDRVLYMYKPDYFDDGTSRVCKLLNSLYGLKQSPLLWYRALDGVLLGVGWKKSQVDKALYFKAGDNGVTSWVLVYVDDLFAASSSPPMLKELKEPLEAAFELRKISLVVKYLGLEIVRDRPARKLWLHQQGYADKLRRRFIDEELGGRVLKASVSVDAYAELTFDDEEAQ
ncbi:unnamed protein product [Closterium sp. NIES-54]